MNIRSANSADFPELLAIQVASIKSLTQTYQPQEIQAWVDYIEAEGPSRYATLTSAIMEDGVNTKSFVSWSVKDQVGKIDCLFVLPEFQHKQAGSQLLRYAEENLPVEKIHIRATLNARKFYEKHRYSFMELATSRAGFSIALMEKYR